MLISSWYPCLWPPITLKKWVAPLPCENWCDCSQDVKAENSSGKPCEMQSINEGPWSKIHWPPHKSCLWQKSRLRRGRILNEYHSFGDRTFYMNVLTTPIIRTFDSCFRQYFSICSMVIKMRALNVLICCSSANAVFFSFTFRCLNCQRVL